MKSPAAFKNASSLGKATARARKALPKSPRKRKTVVRKLFSSIIGEPTGVSSPGQCKSNSLSLSEESVSAVKAFYEREDISRQTPGMKDCLSIKNEQGEKEKVQVRYLCYSILEAHALFQSELNIQIGKSKFAELRPKHIKLSSKLPHNVCLCKYHENFINTVSALHKAIPSFPKYSITFCELFLCDPSSQNCWLGDCEKCANSFIKVAREKVEEEGCCDNDITWYQWKEIDGCLTKIVKEGSVEDLLIYLSEISSQFFQHVYVKREQAASYKNQREEAASVNYNPSVAIVQLDFSENYTCIAQDEIQSYHWGQPQVSLFTCSLWYGGKQHPYVIISENLIHSKDTIIAYLSRILDEIPDDVNQVRIWSDGPSSQFKNKYIAASLKVLQNRKGKKIVWNYFATSHGKGPVDGIGGSVKRSVRQEVLKNKTLVFNAEQFYKAALSSSNVSVILMNDQDIQKYNQDMKVKRIFETAPTIKGISTIYAMDFNRRTGLKTYFLTKEMSEGISSDTEIQPIRKSIYSYVYSSDSESDCENTPFQVNQQVISKNIKNGTFVKISFDQENMSKTYTYAAICQTSVDSEMDVRVLCLNKVSNSNRLFRVNTEESEPYIKFSQILEIIPEPEIKFNGERMYYNFPVDITVCEK